VDPRERWNDLTETLRVAVQRYLGRVWTALPVQLLADSDGHVATVQPTVQARQLNGDGVTYKNVTIGDPNRGLGGETPVVHPSGGGYSLTFPHKKGDEGVVLFSTLCIDGWWDKGGVQPQTDIRRHNLSDSIYLPGVRSNPRKLNPAASASTAQFRTDDGSIFIELDKANNQVRIVVPSGQQVRIEGNVQVTGSITAVGNITAGQGTSDQVDLLQHTHAHGQVPDAGT
jgi:hypothetical protein